MKPARLIILTFLAFSLGISLIFLKSKTYVNAAYISVPVPTPTFTKIIPTSVPTPEPTSIPTPIPTIEPTAVPTAVSTQAPVIVEPVDPTPTSALAPAPVATASVSDQERYMTELVNKERASRGLGALVYDFSLANVARNHCKDMVERGYFSHDTPEGLSPFARMSNAGISYGHAGENLALAPNVDLAMGGLMDSPGHKENILSTSFSRVGIGIYGDKYCQEFTS